MVHISTAEVLEVNELRDDVREYILRIYRARKYPPGSFAQLTLDKVTASDPWPESRPFSIASYRKDTMRFIIQNVGYYTGKIFQKLNVGSVCTVKYPFGDLFIKGTEDERHVFIAGGLGVTPALSFVEYFRSIDKLANLSLLYSEKSYDRVIDGDLLNDTLYKNFHLFLTQESSTMHNSHRINLKYITDIFNSSINIYIVGNIQFINYFKLGLKQHGFDKIHVESWD